MKIYNSLEQGTPEWLKRRELKFTASHASAIATAGKGLETLAYNLFKEHITGEKQNFEGNEATRRGNELEPIARSIYEIEKDVSVEQVGFIERDKYSGCSPDGLVGVDGMWEGKCVNAEKFKAIQEELKKPDSAYIWQCQMQILCAEREWCDLMYFHPDFETNYKIFGIVKDYAKQERLIIGLEIGRKLLLGHLEAYNI